MQIPCSTIYLHSICVAIYFSDLLSFHLSSLDVVRAIICTVHILNNTVHNIYGVLYPVTPSPIAITTHVYNSQYSYLHHLL